jgi:hypothetical protein
MTPEAALQHWLDQRLDAASAQWLRESVATLKGGGTDRDLFRCISLASRKLGKAPLALDAAALAVAEKARPGWDPAPWTVDQAARIRLLLAAATDSDTFVRRLDQLCATADLDELVAFYCGLPIYPDPPRHRLRAAEGVRTNMKVVFEAVAHRNPVSCRAAAGRRLEPDGVEGALRRQHACPDRRSGQPGQCHSGAHAGRLRARTLVGRPPGEPGAVALRGPHLPLARCSQTWHGCSNTVHHPSVPPRCSHLRSAPTPKPA